MASIPNDKSTFISTPTDYRMAVQRLKTSPAQVMQQAEQGSLGDLEVLSDIWMKKYGSPPSSKTHPPSSAIFPPEDFVNLCLTHYQESKIPSEPTQELALTTKRALICIAFFNGGVSVWKAKASRLQNAWKGINQWIKFMIKAVINNPSTPELLRTRTALGISSAWSLALVICGSAKMRSSPGIIEQAARVLFQNYPAQPDAPAAMAPTINRVFSLVLTDYDENSAGARILIASGGDPRRVGRILLDLLEQQVPLVVKGEPPTNIESLSHIFLTLAVAEPKFESAFVEVHGLRRVTKLAVTIAMLLNSTTQDSAHLVDTMTWLLLFIDHAQMCTLGFRWAIEILNAGFLTAWVDFTPHFSKIPQKEMEAGIVKLIRKSLPPFLVYKSVLRVLENTLPIAQSPLHAALVKSSSVNEVWEGFVRVAQNRLDAVKAATAYHNGKECTCDNQQCDLTGDRKLFQKCAQCNFASYCSKACQVAAWKEQGHKEECKNMTVNHWKHCQVSISRSDIRFLAYLAPKLAMEKMATLREIAARDFPGVELHHLIVHVNFGESTPAEPQQISLKNIHNYDPQRPPADRENHCNTGLLHTVNSMAGKGLVLMTELAYNYGDTRISTGVLNRPGFWDVQAPSPALEKMRLVCPIDGKEYEFSKRGNTVVVEPRRD